MFIPNQAQRSVFYSLIDVLLLCSVITFCISLYFVLFVKTSINRNFQMILVAQMTFALCGDIWTALNRPVFLPTLFAVTYAPVFLSVQSKLMALFLTGFFLSLLHCFFVTSIGLGFVKLRLIYSHYKRHIFLGEIFFMTSMLAKEFLTWCVVYDLYFYGNCVDDPKVICTSREMTAFCEQEIPYTIRCFQTPNGIRIWLAIATAIGIILLTMLFISSLISYDFYHPQKYLSKKTLEMQRYFNVIYLAQNIITGFFCLPIGCFVAIILQLIAYNFVEAIAAYWQMFLCFHSSFRNLLIIFASKTYREAIAGWIRRILIFLCISVTTINADTVTNSKATHSVIIVRTAR